MEDERGDEWAARAYGPPHMRMIELPMAAVVVDPAFNCRRHTPERIERACARFEAQPMLHAPTVTRLEGEWRLVAGFLRFAVWQVKNVPSGVFRWIEATSMQALRITNLLENLDRDDLRPHEIVESFVRLREEGMDAYQIAEECGCSDRWVRRLWALKRSAHPELWEAFVAERWPHLTFRRMLDLADHPPDVQLRRLRQMIGAAERADEHARGYREYRDDEGASLESGAAPAPARSRRRLRPRRRVERMQRQVEREARLDPTYRRGLLDAFGWVLGGAEPGLPSGGGLEPGGALASASYAPSSSPVSDRDDDAAE